MNGNQNLPAGHNPVRTVVARSRHISALRQGIEISRAMINSGAAQERLCRLRKAVR
jgi:hypothetical protein